MSEETHANTEEKEIVIEDSGQAIDMAQETMEAFIETANVSKVYGEPIQHEDTLILPAAEVLAVPIETGTVWDSYAAALAIVEAIVARSAELTWDETRERIELWDATRALTTETKT